MPLLDVLTGRMIADGPGGTWRGEWESEATMKWDDDQGRPQEKQIVFLSFGNWVDLKMGDLTITLEVELDGDEVQVESPGGFEFVGWLEDPGLIDQLKSQVDAWKWGPDDVQR